jgi:hypothetical protein
MQRVGDLMMAGDDIETAIERAAQQVIDGERLPPDDLAAIKEAGNIPGWDDDQDHAGTVPAVGAQSGATRPQEGGGPPAVGGGGEAQTGEAPSRHSGEGAIAEAQRTVAWTKDKTGETATVNGYSLHVEYGRGGNENWNWRIERAAYMPGAPEARSGSVRGDKGAKEAAIRAAFDTRPAPGEYGRTEHTDAGEQGVLPGAEKIGQGEQAQRGADKPLKPKVAQQPADEGIFGDSSQQTDLVDMAKRPAPKGATDVGSDVQGERGRGAGEGEPASPGVASAGADRPGAVELPAGEIPGEYQAPVYLSRRNRAIR